MATPCSSSTPTTCPMCVSSHFALYLSTSFLTHLFLPLHLILLRPFILTHPPSFVHRAVAPALVLIPLSPYILPLLSPCLVHSIVILIFRTLDLRPLDRVLDHAALSILPSRFRDADRHREPTVSKSTATNVPASTAGSGAVPTSSSTSAAASTCVVAVGAVAMVGVGVAAL
ncbi:hypothetical protein K438DRAFT_752142 [Mycena galopus ATCC 62051]|nr:hypothetical protein K438DRAFT_752142 [Mycena galopus ATCC 62051]